MKNNFHRIFLILLLSGLALLGWKYLSTPAIEVVACPTSNPNPKEKEDTKKKDILENLKQRLISAGWKSETAEAFVTLNKTRYRDLFETCGRVNESEIEKLENLRPTGEVDRLIREFPMVASLCTMTKSPELLAQSILKLDNFDSQKGLINTFYPIDDTASANAWNSSVSRFGVQIAALSERNLDPEFQLSYLYSIFMYPGFEKDPIKKYDAWLKTIFHPASLPRNDRQIMSLMSFVVQQGENIRRKMDKDDEFSEEFIETLWPAFDECTTEMSQQLGLDFAAYPMMGQDPLLWDLLAYKNGKELFLKNGDWAIELLFGENKVPIELRSRAASLLLNSGEEAVDKLFTGPWLNHPQFIRLLQNRNISDAQLLTVASRLSATNGDFQPLLTKWQNMSPAGFDAEIEPPPNGALSLIPGWGVYYVGLKLVQGRDLDFGDAVNVAGDAFFFVPAIKGAKIISQAEKQVVKMAIKKTVVETAEKTVENTLKILVEKSKNQIVSKIPTEGLNITKVVEDAFKLTKQLGGNREIFKNFTKQEARIFMRKDRKVILTFPLKTLALEKALDGGVTIGSDSEYVQQKIKLESLRSLEKAETWEENMAAWWAGNSCGLFEN